MYKNSPHAFAYLVKDPVESTETSSRDNSGDHYSANTKNNYLKIKNSHRYWPHQKTLKILEMLRTHFCVSIHNQLNSSDIP